MIRSVRASPTFLTALFGTGMMLGCSGLLTADIRPDSIGLEPDPVLEKKGRDALQAAFDAHGGAEALLSRKTATFQMTDTWVGMGTLFNPWPDDAQRVTMSTVIHTFDSEALLHNGPEAGVTWGITSGRTWRRINGVKTMGQDPDIQFILPTSQYFLELPQRLTEAGIVQFVGEEEVRGVRYDVVFATWTTLAANPDYDQYRVYINQQTGRIDKVWYTVRELGGLFTGICHLDNHQETDGYWVPFTLSVTAAIDDDPDDYIHRMELSYFNFDPS